MSAAARATIIAGLLAAVPLVIAIAGGGASSIVTTAACTFGLGLFVAGVWGGHSGMVIGGIGATACGSAVGLGSSTLDVIGLLLIGAVVPVALMVADASWWLRREARVDLRVGLAIARRLVPAIGVGIAVTVGALWAADQGPWPLWLVPVTVAALAVTLAAAGEISWRRRPAPTDGVDRGAGGRGAAGRLDQGRR